MFVLSVTSVEEARIACERAGIAIGTTVVDKPGGGKLPRVTISLGVAELRTGWTPPELLKAAAVAMYRANKGGRNRVVVDGA